ncbi:MAG: tRNA (cytidine(34)-2'-O)-methyltransferase [Candidatus Marinimicrobia bacterium]|jgi:tRNA (cytidine/uridine-2'-O-)-methyltransferase|nr:tRNA (cytidine(34)-2'-O)-methyltransferase [Candidatus Neomarinimicrobiota bacterium]MBT3937587.1 tRNA (cytidine(34)-2'-O)-methyltransferase [Candidatus Neomarinimicrobiota bacterium]MBT3960706.1 tRNA (cytidine(34)-2'-O)-methyltransferase [Candidatus Neomarinimicrobiota bacterium]MBT4382896.1 tRNA (cytidine(34)-2'-O)-methyltransferase [Candidatus Neomarinimicrobiota bacterium]MBT4635096.1 tRNA (cytidine(34)-2'-O)-methyltransferase [Candidatus Neomarinimicrobiota bacterium]
MITVVLLDPKIPPNTGSTARLCGAMNVKLDIVGNIGFELTDSRLKRAGLDYWDHIEWKYHADRDSYISELVKKRFHFLSTKSDKPYTKCEFKDGDYLVFGSETAGIEESLLKKYWDNTCTIPMINPNIRSLNLATSVGIVLYEALRQTDAY